VGTVAGKGQGTWAATPCNPAGSAHAIVVSSLVSLLLAITDEKKIAEVEMQLGTVVFIFETSATSNGSLVQNGGVGGRKCKLGKGKKLLLYLAFSI